MGSEVAIVALAFLFYSLPSLLTDFCCDDVMSLFEIVYMCMYVFVYFIHSAHL